MILIEIITDSMIEFIIDSMISVVGVITDSIRGRKLKGKIDILNFFYHMSGKKTFFFVNILYLLFNMFNLTFRCMEQTLKIFTNNKKKKKLSYWFIINSTFYLIGFEFKSIEIMRIFFILLLLILHIPIFFICDFFLSFF